MVIQITGYMVLKYGSAGAATFAGVSDQKCRVTPPTTRLGGRTTRSSSYTDWSAAVSRKKFRTAKSISHFALLKLKKGNDCRTCTSKRLSNPGPGAPSATLPARANPLLTRYITRTRVAVSGTVVSTVVDTSCSRSGTPRTADGASSIR